MTTAIPVELRRQILFELARIITPQIRAMVAEDRPLAIEEARAAMMVLAKALAEETEEEHAP
jgi:hypothetical protein